MKRTLLFSRGWPFSSSTVSRKSCPFFEKVAQVVKVVPPFQTVLPFSDNKILLFKMAHLGDRRTEGTEGTKLVRNEAGSLHVPVMEK